MTKLKNTKTKNLSICNCEKPEFALCTPVCMTDEGIELLKANAEYINKYVCFECGGISKNKPEVYSHITGETVVMRLVDLGVINKQ